MRNKLLKACRGDLGHSLRLSILIRVHYPDLELPSLHLGQCSFNPLFSKLNDCLTTIRVSISGLSFQGLGAKGRQVIGEAKVNPGY